jgi:predicted RNA-binding protein YlqC (UPF0109 family)
MSEEQTTDVRALVEQMAKALVEAPGEVSVTLAGEGSPVLELRVAPGDLGKVIGKQGRTARAMRSIVSAAGMRLNQRVQLEIVE